MKATEFCDAVNRVMELFGKPNLTEVPANRIQEQKIGRDKSNDFLDVLLEYEEKKCSLLGRKRQAALLKGAIAELPHHLKSMKDVREKLNRVAGSRQQR
ncbi:hypothetical protein SADUNF_Sadunf06G0095300 [Salix dunnii]|uniref:Uncharacterized protein n=1 Tax=Salix dunnii TaxID=1413687 RepID=A0A835K3F3_9ROSI|nr:hypothetical protein SADUNF_Sadunf06G0095300 [Salix dunnii]